ncbi:lipopolysaccharide assembly protein LapB [Nocardia sp. CC227C]|uniref:tetratricopeptide repeat protein n=1 Tax=Nocardia sp. CC227C TaxID=3044562 RepID=UPI00278BB836|nr:tetratricopeptide repeat protein [Nocardia sp. CC227C]
MHTDIERARVLAQLNRPEQARALLATVIGGEPDNVDALELLAAVDYELDDLERALDHAASALALAPENPFLLRVTALAYLSLGLRSPDGSSERHELLSRAVGAARSAVELDPWDPECHYTHGLVLVDAEQDDHGAMAAFERALELDPHHINTLLVRASVSRLRLADLGRAEADLREVLRLDPENGGALYSLAMVDAERGHYRAATRRLQEVARLDPSRADVVRARLAELADAHSVRRRARRTVAEPAESGAAVPESTRSPRWARWVAVLIVFLAIRGVIAVVSNEGGSHESPTRTPTTTYSRHPGYLPPMPPTYLPRPPTFPTYRPPVFLPPAR